MKHGAPVPGSRALALGANEFDRSEDDALVEKSLGRLKAALFTVSVPVKPFTIHIRQDSDGDSSAQAIDSDAKYRGTLAALRVLVVEDEPDALELIDLLLAREGAIVATAASACSALEQLDAFDPDILVSDIGLPEHDGYWLVQQVHARKPELPAIALTAFSRREDRDRAFAAGFHKHLGKPVDPEHLVATVRSSARPLA